MSLGNLGYILLYKDENTLNSQNSLNSLTRNYYYLHHQNLLLNVVRCGADTKKVRMGSTAVRPIRTFDLSAADYGFSQ